LQVTYPRVKIFFLKHTRVKKIKAAYSEVRRKLPSYWVDWQANQPTVGLKRICIFVVVVVVVTVLVALCSGACYANLVATLPWGSSGVDCWLENDPIWQSQGVN
jgi:hypothetical protein